MKHTLLLFVISILLLPSQVCAQKRHQVQSEVSRMSGLYLSVDAGLLVANPKQASFYSGNPEYCTNTIDRVLHSDLYGREIWSNLVDGGLISPTAVPSYRELTVAEYASNMYYKLTYQLGVGFRYVYDNQWGWLLRFDYSQLTAAGRFNIDASNSTSLLGHKQYVTCDVFGVEKRTLIDLGIFKRIPLSRVLDLEVCGGFDVNSTSVQQNGMRINGRTYSILDVWGGMSPYTGIAPYPYANEGRVGIGYFGSVAFSYLSKAGAIDVGYQCYWMQTKFVGFNEEDAYAHQHNIFFRFSINNFKFFD